MPSEVIRTFPFKVALVLLRTAPPLVTGLRPWTARPVLGPRSGNSGRSEPKSKRLSAVGKTIPPRRAEGRRQVAPMIVRR